MNFLAAYFRIEFLKRPPTVCLKNRIGTRRTVSRIHTPVSYISSNKFMVSCSRSRVCTLLVRLFENRVTFLKIENFPRNSSCVCAHNRLVKTFLVGKLKFSFSFFSLSSLLYRYLAKVRERVQPYEGELFINGSPKSCLATSRRTFFEHRNRGRIYSSGLCEKIDFDPEPSSTHLTKSRLLLSKFALLFWYSHSRIAFFKMKRKTRMCPYRPIFFSSRIQISSSTSSSFISFISSAFDRYFRPTSL